MPAISISNRAARFVRPVPRRDCMTVGCYHHTTGKKFPGHFFTPSGLVFCVSCWQRYSLIRLGEIFFREAVRHDWDTWEDYVVTSHLVRDWIRWKHFVLTGSCHEITQWCILYALELESYHFDPSDI